MTDLLTPAEHQAMRTTVDLYHQLARVVADGPSRPGDMAEVVHHIHGLQRMILAQAAARAYPDQYRLLGADSPGPLPTSITAAVNAYKNRVGL